MNITLVKEKNRYFEAAKVLKRVKMQTDLMNGFTLFSREDNSTDTFALWCAKNNDISEMNEKLDMTGAPRHNMLFCVISDNLFTVFKKKKFMNTEGSAVYLKVEL
jgi:hypothetical protein